MAKQSRMQVTLGADIREFQKKFKTATKDLQNAGKQMQKTGQQMKGAFKGVETAAGKSMAGAKSKVDDLKNAAEAASKKLRKLGDSVSGYGRDIGMTFGVAGLSVAAGLGYAVKKSMDLEQALADIKAVAPELAGSMGAVKDIAIEMGAKTKYSSIEAAKGFEELIKAGVSTKDIMKGGLAGALNLATAGELDLATAAEIASTVLNAFKKDNLSVAQAADILAGGANASATSVMELRYGLAAVSSVAAGMGMSFRDTSTALAVFAQSGLKGSDAGTSLKTMLMNLQPRTKEQIALFKKLGFVTADGKSKFYDASGSMKSLSEIAGLLQTNMAGLTDAQRAMALETIFGSDAVRGANILFEQGADGVNHMWDAMSKTTAADVAATKMNTLKGDVEKLQGAFETAATSIGDALRPAVQDVTHLLQGMVDKFNMLSEPMKRNIAVGAAVGAGLLLLTSIVGFLVMGLGALAAAEWAVLLPVVAIIAGVALLIAAFIWAYTQIDWFRAGVNTAFSFIWGIIKQVMDAVVSFIKDKLTLIKNWWKKNGDMIMQAVDNVWGVISKIIDVAMALIVMIIQGTWKAIKGLISGAINVILGVIQFFAALFTGNWGAMWDAVKLILKGALQLVWNFILLTFGRVLKFIGGFVGKALGVVAKWVGGMVKWVANLFAKWIGKAGSGLKTVRGFFSDMVTKVATTIKNWSVDMALRFLGIVNKAKEIFAKVVDFIVQPFKDAWKAGKDILGKIKSGFAKLKLKIPKPKLPHISVDMKVKKLAGLPDIPYPDFDLNWYKTGGMFNGPSMIGVGEQPGVKEVAMPLSGRHMKPFADAVAENMPDTGGGDTIIIKQMVVREEADIDRVATKLDEKRRRRKRTIKDR